VRRVVVGWESAFRSRAFTTANMFGGETRRF
jgi:hypothetical protein